jgi:hypothetical protein
MSASWLITLLTLACGLIGTVLGELASQEIRTRLDRIPQALIRLAARRVPADLRADRAEEWLADLHEILRGAEALPITRIITGTRYALGLLRASSAIARDLHGSLTPSETPAPPELAPGETPLSAAAQLAGEQDAAVWKALGRLPERSQRLVRLLIADPPYSYEQIADILGMKVGTIGPARARALHQLRNLAGLDGSEP